MRSFLLLTALLLGLAASALPTAAAAPGDCGGPGPYETVTNFDTSCTDPQMGATCTIWTRAPPVGGPAICVEGSVWE